MNEKQLQRSRSVEKLTAIQLVKFPSFYATSCFITVFTMSATGFYSGPDESSPHSPNQYILDPV